MSEHAPLRDKTLSWARGPSALTFANLSVTFPAAFSHSDEVLTTAAEEIDILPTVAVIAHPAGALQHSKAPGCTTKLAPTSATGSSCAWRT